MSHSDTVPSASSDQRGFEVLDAEHLDARLNAVREALRLCPTEVPASLSIPAHKALDAVAQRLALGVDHTVVALFGGTGSGKSSLFNALTQLNFADVGARRPTTSRAAACSWGDDAAATIEAWVGYLEANIESPQDIRRLSPGSVIDLLISAAAGVDGAVAAARRLGLEEQTAQAGALLVEAVTEALTATVPKGAATSLAPAPGFAAALRLRSGELKPFTRPGATA